MGMAQDLANQYSDPTGDPELDQWAGNRTSPYLNQLLKSGVPPDVAAYILGAPSFAEGERPHSTRRWETPYEDIEPTGPDEVGSAYERWLLQHLRQRPRGAQDINYQPGASAMPGMPWDSSSGGGQPQMSPQDLQRWQTVMRLLGGSRGGGGMVNPFGGGMQFGQGAPSGGLANQLVNPGQQGGLMAMIMQNPQLLQWFMQQQGGQGAFPQGGGGFDGGANVTLAQLLGTPQQTGQSA